MAVQKAMGHGRAGTGFERKGSEWLCQAVLMNSTLLYLTTYFAQTKDMGSFSPHSHQARQHHILGQTNSGQTAAKSELVNQGGHMSQIYQHSTRLVASCHPFCLWHYFVLTVQPGHVFSKPWKFSRSFLRGRNMRWEREESAFVNFWVVKPCASKDSFCSLRDSAFPSNLPRTAVS